jgi:PKD repeat protein
VDSDLAHSSVRRISFVAAVALLAVALALAPASTPAAMNDIPTSFTWAPASPTPGQVVTFTATPDLPAGVTIKNYDWDLNGDGAVDEHGSTATWSYPAPGPVSVHLSIKGSGPHRGEAARTVTVQAAGGGGAPAPKPPVASFTISPAAPVINQPVLFTSTSADPDGTVEEQAWDLNGDGSYDNGGGATALRAFSTPGVYVIGLRVTDDAGLVAFYSRTLTVLPAAVTPLTVQKSAPRLLNPFPVVRVAGRITRRGTRVRVLRVDTPIGTKISVRCTGRSCPFRKQVRSVPANAQSRATIHVRVRRLERLLLPGVQVRVYVTKPGAVGKYTRLRFRARKAPGRTDRCLVPGSWAPAECTGF